MTWFSKLICKCCESSAGVLEKDCHGRGTVHEYGSYAKLQHWPFWYTLKKYHSKTSDKFLYTKYNKNYLQIREVSKSYFLLVQSSLEVSDYSKLLWLTSWHTFLSITMSALVLNLWETEWERLDPTHARIPPLISTYIRNQAYVQQ